MSQNSDVVVVGRAVDGTIILPDKTEEQLQSLPMCFSVCKENFAKGIVILKIEIAVWLAVIALDLHMPKPQLVAWDADCVRGMEGRDSQILR